MQKKAEIQQRLKTENKPRIKNSRDTFLLVFLKFNVYTFTHTHKKMQRRTFFKFLVKLSIFIKLPDKIRNLHKKEKKIRI